MILSLSADHIVVLKDGKIESQGTYGELLASGFDLKALFGSEDGNDIDDEYDENTANPSRNLDPNRSDDKNNDDLHPVDSGRTESSHCEVGRRRKVGTPQACTLISVRNSSK